jgi:hypothetical protein
MGMLEVELEGDSSSPKQLRKQNVVSGSSSVC